MGMIVVGGVVEKNGKYLLIQEAREDIKGKWNLPAGNLDPGETIFDGAKREIYEESGCKVEIKKIAQIGNIIMKDNTFISLIFLCELLEESSNYKKDEVLNVKWFTYEEILDMKKELRAPDWIINSIKNVKVNNVHDIKIIDVIN